MNSNKTTAFSYFSFEMKNFEISRILKSLNFSKFYFGKNFMRKKKCLTKWISHKTISFFTQKTPKKSLFSTKKKKRQKIENPAKNRFFATKVISKTPLYKTPLVVIQQTTKNHQKINFFFFSKIEKKTFWSTPVVPAQAPSRTAQHATNAPAVDPVQSAPTRPCARRTARPAAPVYGWKKTLEGR